MKLYYNDKDYKLYHGSMLDILDVIDLNSIDSIVTDPPYEIGFMNKNWDSTGIAFNKDTWYKCYEVLKPGGYLLAFGGSRTFHRIACAIEDAGFEIRDTIMWIYGSGFPKSMNLGKAIEAKLTTGSANTQEFKNLNGTKTKSGNWGLNANNEFYGARPSDYSADGHERTVDVNYSTEEGKKWNGWGTALKPAYEPIIVARKPCDGSTTDNVLKYGVGGINIDECRVEQSGIVEDLGRKNNVKSYGGITIHESNTPAIDRSGRFEGRFPSNVILTYDETDEKEVCSGMPNTSGGDRHNIAVRQSDKNSGYGFDLNTRNEFNDSGSAARYFYCAKASKRDRDEGLENFKKQIGGGMNGTADQSLLTGSGNIRNNMRKNTHPTVKPTELMQYLIRLVTPNGGTILDPFNGSGSTGKACMWENRDNNKKYKYIGVELQEQYLLMSKSRIDYAKNTKYIPLASKNLDKTKLTNKRIKLF